MTNLESVGDSRVSTPDQKLHNDLTDTNGHNDNYNNVCPTVKNDFINQIDLDTPTKRYRKPFYMSKHQVSSEPNLRQRLAAYRERFKKRDLNHIDLSNYRPETAIRQEDIIYPNNVYTGESHNPVTIARKNNGFFKRNVFSFWRLLNITTGHKRIILTQIIFLLLLLISIFLGYSQHIAKLRKLKHRQLIKIYHNSISDLKQMCISPDLNGLNKPKNLRSQKDVDIKDKLLAQLNEANQPPIDISKSYKHHHPSPSVDMPFMPKEIRIFSSSALRIPTSFYRKQSDPQDSLLLCVEPSIKLYLNSFFIATKRILIKMKQLLIIRRQTTEMNILKENNNNSLKNTNNSTSLLSVWEIPTNNNMFPMTIEHVVLPLLTGHISMTLSNFWKPLREKKNSNQLENILDRLCSSNTKFSDSPFCQLHTLDSGNRKSFLKNSKTIILDNNINNDLWKIIKNIILLPIYWLREYRYVYENLSVNYFNNVYQQALSAITANLLPTLVNFLSDEDQSKLTSFQNIENQQNIIPTKNNNIEIYEIFPFLERLNVFFQSGGFKSPCYPLHYYFQKAFSSNFGFVAYLLLLMGWLPNSLFSPYPVTLIHAPRLFLYFLFIMYRYIFLYVFGNFIEYYTFDTYHDYSDHLVLYMLFIFIISIEFVTIYNNNLALDNIKTTIKIPIYDNSESNDWKNYIRKMFVLRSYNSYWFYKFVYLCLYLYYGILVCCLLYLALYTSWFSHSGSELLTGYLVGFFGLFVYFWALLFNGYPPISVTGYCAKLSSTSKVNTMEKSQNNMVNEECTLSNQYMKKLFSFIHFQRIFSIIYKLFSIWKKKIGFLSKNNSNSHNNS